MTFHVRVSVPAEFAVVSVSVPLLASVIGAPSMVQLTDGSVPDTLTENTSVVPKGKGPMVPPGATPLTLAELMLGATTAGGGVDGDGAEGGGGGG